jgi:2-polyprenyl-6-methoxyphenol hydroxylase-like FAD-dependent oxidoreductase
MSTPLVLVVGAGPSGMTTAIELRRAGLNVRIIDKSSHPALHSQALVVQARTLEQLQRYGIAETAVAAGRKLTAAKFFSEGKELLSFELNRIPSRYHYALFLPQNDTEAILNCFMESLGVEIERQTELVSFSQDTGGVTATLRRLDGAQETIQPRWIIGCDGAHSVVRQMSQIAFEGEVISLSFFLGDLELDGPDAPTDFLAIHLHKGNVVFMGRLSDKLTRVIVALHSGQEQDTGQELSLKDFQDPIDEAGIRVKVHSAEWMTPFHVNDRQASHYRNGNVFLVGDASHIHSPVGGQGMNTGMQDAANLAWKLAAVARGADDGLLDSYEEERSAVGKALLKSTGRGLRMATSSNPIVEAFRDALLPHIASISSVQERMLGFISETAIEYRSSSIVEDHGGDGSLRAGDRMPDLSIGEKDGANRLLQQWTESSHFALMLNGTEDEKSRVKAQLANTSLRSLHSSDLDDQGLSMLGKEAKIVVVRPDGYVGFRGPIDKTESLLAYLGKTGALQPVLAP